MATQHVLSLDSRGVSARERERALQRGLPTLFRTHETQDTAEYDTKARLPRGHQHLLLRRNQAEYSVIGVYESMAGAEEAVRVLAGGWHAGLS